MDLARLFYSTADYTTSCYNTTKGTDYQGEISVTGTGKTCQHWSTQSPHKHSMTNAKAYPDATVKNAQNYCRNPVRSH